MTSLISPMAPFLPETPIRRQCSSLTPYAKTRLKVREVDDDDDDDE